MSRGMLNIRFFQPRMLTVKEAAEYTGMKAAKFSACCPVAPVDLPGNGPAYDIRDLDHWLDQLKVGSADSDDAILKLLD